MQLKRVLLPLFGAVLSPVVAAQAADGPGPAGEKICLIAGWENPASVCVTHTRTIAATCYNCHGPNGNSSAAIPSLAGQERAYFVQAMKDFKSGQRESSVMKRYAMGYSDSEYEALAELFASIN